MNSINMLKFALLFKPILIFLLCENVYINMKLHGVAKTKGFFNNLKFQLCRHILSLFCQLPWSVELGLQYKSSLFHSHIGLFKKGWPGELPRSFQDILQWVVMLKGSWSSLEDKLQWFWWSPVKGLDCSKNH